jgi:hypothetical protein
VERRENPPIEDPEDAGMTPMDVDCGDQIEGSFGSFSLWRL